jgi:hypothetical protein
MICSSCDTARVDAHSVKSIVVDFPSQDVQKFVCPTKCGVCWSEDTVCSSFSRYGQPEDDRLDLRFSRRVELNLNGCSHSFTARHNLVRRTCSSLQAEIQGRQIRGGRKSATVESVWPVLSQRSKSPGTRLHVYMPRLHAQIKFQGFRVTQATHQVSKEETRYTSAGSAKITSIT